MLKQIVIKKFTLHNVVDYRIDQKYVVVYVINKIIGEIMFYFNSVVLYIFFYRIAYGCKQEVNYNFKSIETSLNILFNSFLFIYF